MSAEERRHHERFSMEIQVKMTAETWSGKTPMMEFLTANISAGGAFIETDAPLPLASRVRLEFLLALENLEALKFIVSLETLKAWKGKRVWISASGIVVRHETDGMGIMFDENYQINPMVTSDDGEKKEA
ncbi:MAG TPA: PilZ domain-containing protein [Desulfocapsa sulfexigens]|nr:PilZ domain-containing protein [Desulfocapsa sulfexigens]